MTGIEWCFIVRIKLIEMNRRELRKGYAVVLGIIDELFKGHAGNFGICYTAMIARNRRLITCEQYDLIRGDLSKLKREFGDYVWRPGELEVRKDFMKKRIKELKPSLWRRKRD